MGVVAYKYHCFGILHTWGNKLTGLLLFTAPLFIMFNKIHLLWIIVLVAVLSSIEELIIHLTSSKLELDRKSIFKS
jgi:CDP-diacylglycerol--glycerol-3-phosphate 3-phosphatidyltransferase